MYMYIYIGYTSKNDKWMFVSLELEVVLGIIRWHTPSVDLIDKVMFIFSIDNTIVIAPVCLHSILQLMYMDMVKVVQ